MRLKRNLAPNQEILKLSRDTHVFVLSWGIRKEHARINTVLLQQEKVDQVESDRLDLIISPTRIARLSAGSVGWETGLTQ